MNRRLLVDYPTLVISSPGFLMLDTHVDAFNYDSASGRLDFKNLT